MTINNIKLVVIIIFAISLIGITAFRTEPTVTATVNGDDPAATFKAKCAACHSPTLAKFYDPAKTEEQHVQAILKGVKGEKPPFMPGFEAKGMTEDEAKGLAAYMKSLRPPAN